jgi:hypothetical protein
MHIAGPTTSERHRRGLVTFIVDMLAARKPKTEAEGPYTYLTLEIVERQSGATVRSWGELPVTTTGLAREIESDLDRLDPNAFAAKWDLGASPTA